MKYEILEARIEYAANKLTRVTVLVNCTGNYSEPYTDVRAIYATSKPCGGYMWLETDMVLSEKLLQQVAAQGMETVDREDIFPKWRAKVFLATHKKQSHE